MVRKLSLAIVFMGTLVIGFTAFAAPVSATTCSGRYKTCPTSMPPWKALPPCMCSGFIKLPPDRMLG